MERQPWSDSHQKTLSQEVVLCRDATRAAALFGNSSGGGGPPSAPVPSIVPEFSIFGNKSGRRSRKDKVYFQDPPPHLTSLRWRECLVGFFGARWEFGLPNVMLSPACLSAPGIPASASDPHAAARPAQRSGRQEEDREQELKRYAGWNFLIVPISHR